MECIFCALAKASDHLFNTEHFFGVWDIDPVQQGHLLIISKEHRMNISELNSNELVEMIHLQKELTQIFERCDSVLGVTTLYNNGKIMMNKTHFHFHIIPRYNDDGFYDNQIIQHHPIDKILLAKKLVELSSIF